MRNGSTETGPAALARFITVKLKALGWRQKRLADEAGVSDTSISELVLQQTNLSLDMAKALAGVDELETTAEQLLRMAGQLTTNELADIPGKRAARIKVAEQIIGKLTDEDLDIATSLLMALRRRRKR